MKKNQNFGNLKHTTLMVSLNLRNLRLNYSPTGSSQLNLQTQNRHLSDWRVIVRQILNGLLHLHSNGICHRALKPGNIFISHRNEPTSLVKVANFGFTRIFHEKDKTSLVIGNILIFTYIL